MAKLKGLFFAGDGLRPVWRIAAGAAAYAAAMCAVIGGLGWLFGKLFDAWGLTTSNLAYAPRWAQRIVAGHTGFVYGLAYIASIFAALAVSKKPERKRIVCPQCGVLVGLAMAVGLTVLSLAADSMRTELPLREPTLAVVQLGALIVLILGKLSTEVLTKRVVFGQLGRRWLAYALSTAVSMVLTAVWFEPLGIINALLLGLLACVLYERGGLIASAGMHAAWAAWCSLVFGFPGMSASSKPVYALYHVSETWLTGGSAGPVCGIWVTVFCSALLIWLCRSEIIIFAMKAIKRRSSHGKDQNRNRRSGI